MEADMSSTLPKLVIALCNNHDAWIVGSSARPDAVHPVRDYDVQVTFSEWGKAAHLIPRDAVPNSFGGWKCKSDGIEVDVWPGELGWLMQNSRAVWAWHPSSDVRLTKAT